jgi:hypothetical protein
MLDPVDPLGAWRPFVKQHVVRDDEAVSRAMAELDEFRERRTTLRVEIAREIAERKQPPVFSSELVR